MLTVGLEMLEVTILKVWHSGKSEAEKLIPYIRDCDVWSPENFLTEAGVSRLETYCAAAVRRGWQVSEAERKLVRQFTCDYTRIQLEHVLCLRRPLFFLERHQQEGYETLERMWATAENEIEVAHTELKKGYWNLFLNRIWDHIGTTDSFVHFRDTHMARNLAKAERLIRTTYPQLRHTDPLRLTAWVGSVHSPEKHTNMPITVHSLSPEDAKKLTKTPYHLRMQGLPFEDAEAALLRHGAALLSEWGLLNLSEEAIKAANPYELKLAMKEMADRNYGLKKSA